MSEIIVAVRFEMVLKRTHRSVKKCGTCKVYGLMDKVEYNVIQRLLKFN